MLPIICKPLAIHRKLIIIVENSCKDFASVLDDHLNITLRLGFDVSWVWDSRKFDSSLRIDIGEVKVTKKREMSPGIECQKSSYLCPMMKSLGGGLELGGFYGCGK